MALIHDEHCLISMRENGRQLPRRIDDGDDELLGPDPLLAASERSYVVASHAEVFGERDVPLIKQGGCRNDDTDVAVWIVLQPGFDAMQREGRLTRTRDRGDDPSAGLEPQVERFRTAILAAAVGCVLTPCFKNRPLDPWT